MKRIHFITEVYGYYYRKFELGRDYVIPSRSANPTIVRFIKVTPKGFNLLNLRTNKCILKSHLYDRQFVGKDKKVPRDVEFLTVTVPYWLPSPELIAKEETG